MVGIPTNCALQETFSALLEIEEHILSKKTEAWRWGNLIDSQSITETLYALSFLVFVRGRIEQSVEPILLDLVSEAQQHLTSNREFLKPYILGHAALVCLKQEEIKDAIQTFDETLIKYLTSSPREYAIEILYSLSMFVNILHRTRNLNSNFVSMLHDNTKEILYKNLDTLDPDSFAKLLYAFSAFSKSKTDLKTLFDQHKNRIISLREKVSSPLIKATLLRFFSIMEIDCHKTIIDEALEPIRNRKETGIYRNLRSRISRYFLYGEPHQDGVEVKINSDKTINLIIDIAPPELDNLREADYSIEYAGTVGICLITAGYSQVFIVPPLEEEEYLKFLKSDSKKHDYVRKDGLRTLVNNQVDDKLKIADYKVVLGLIAIVFSGIILSQILDFLQLMEDSPLSNSAVTILLFFFTQMVLKIYSDRSKTIPLDVYHRAFKRRELKNTLHKELVSTLEVSDGWDMGFDYE